MTKFYVSSIDIDDSTPDGRKVKNALSEQSSMSITGHTWQQERAFGMAEQAIGKWVVEATEVDSWEVLWP